MLLEHISYYKEIVIQNHEYKQSSSSFKPNGFWYSVNNCWKNFLKNEMGVTEKIYKHKFNLQAKFYTDLNNLNKNKILKLNTKFKFVNFVLKYYSIHNTNKKKSGDCYLLINWKKVSQDFGGIEIMPFREEFSKNYCQDKYEEISHGKLIDNIQKYILNKINVIEKKKLNISKDIIFYSSWDVPSGCIWNTDILVQLF
ncbi:hypothetical protein Catovirus_1_48 [Catovirus CTV1]|uniref:Uncharacterized protein n=1 Tax=Catovirus CTV1 TaxID=1977631 RepID=A0A1V0S8M7_9VIRU|nr:hypothetical protein Catovirus_1_48 [Catovirus CTV1]